MLDNHLHIDDETFVKRQAANLLLVNDLKQKLSDVSLGGGVDAVQRHINRGKLTARQRIDYLVDAHAPFVELSALAAYDQYNNAFASAGLITGIGMVNGRYVMIVANDATVKGGTYVKETIKKHLRAQEIAMQNSLPCVYMVDSGGVFLPEQANVFPDKNDFGRIFFNQARLSAMGLAQIAIVMGSCTAGGAYIPAMCDETIIVRNQGTIFLAGPPLVKAATGEIVTDEELGGGLVHAQKSGVADHLADNDVHAIHICRQIIDTLPQPSTAQNFNYTSPAKEGDFLYGLIPPQGEPFPDILQVVEAIVDQKSFLEFKKEYGSTILTGFASIAGCKIGVLANNGVLFGESAQKGAHFIQLCNSRNIPMLFLQNITGFMVGKAYEHGGIAKDGAKMVNALANSKVPFITIIIGGSYGAGNYAMAGRAFDPRFLFMWPNSRISVMGAKQAADVLVSIKKGSSAQSSDSDETLRREIFEKYSREGSPYYSTSRLWDDGVIDPAQTRSLLAFLFSMMVKSTNAQLKTNQYGIFRM